MAGSALLAACLLQAQADTAQAAQVSGKSSSPAVAATANDAAAPAEPASRAEEPLRAEVNAPVKNFRLPVFDDAGNRQWDLLGTEGEYIDRNDIRVSDMTLRTYVKDDPLKPRLLIQSPTALIQPLDGVAKGPDYLYITEANSNYFIIGRDWKWDSKAQRITIGAEVRVTFRERLGSVLN